MAISAAVAICARNGRCLDRATVAPCFRLDTSLPLLFFSFARTKLPNYVALEFPALALLTALYFDAVVRKGVNAFGASFPRRSSR